MKETKRPVERDDEPNDLSERKAQASTATSEPTGPTPLSFTIEPTSGPEHTAITITGTDFGDTPGTLALNEVPAPVVIWTPLAIQTIVPYGATSGDLVVTTSDGRRGSAPFTVTTPDA